MNFDDYSEKVKKVHKMIEEKTGEGNDFLGWTTWPTDYDKEELERIIADAKYVRDNFDVLVVCGIGGSYLGARAVIEALSNNFGERRVIFAGNNLNSDKKIILQDVVE